MKNGQLEIGEPIEANLTLDGKILATGQARRIGGGFSFATDKDFESISKAQLIEKAITPGGIVTLGPWRITSIEPADSLKGVYRLTVV